MRTAEKQYIDAFEDELRSFLTRIQQRAQVRIEAAMKEAEEVRVVQTVTFLVALDIIKLVYSSCVFDYIGIVVQWL